jgi:hypothetical protein
VGAFAKLRKATISFVMSVRPPARMEQLGCHLTDFHKILSLPVFRNSGEEFLVSLKFAENNEYFT